MRLAISFLLSKNSNFLWRKNAAYYTPIGVYTPIGTFLQPINKTDFKNIILNKSWLV